MKVKHGCCLDKVCTSDTCMNLPDGKTCGDCKRFNGCSAMYGMKKDSANCDFFPRRFVAITTDRKDGEG